MTQITSDHVEWAVVGRLRRMLEEPRHPEFNVTHAYALFTTMLCWVMQRIRIPTHQIVTPNDRIAHEVFKTLSGAKIGDGPWRVHVKPVQRIESVGKNTFAVPAPANFESHTVDRFLINLRDATAHGDARNVSPFNITVSSRQLLAGFNFDCAEFENRKKTWEGTITLLEDDLRRIASQLGKIYCDALRHDEAHRHDSHFGADAGSVKEVAA